MTLDAFYTDTSIEKGTDTNEFYLNDKKQSLANSQRVFNYIEKLQQRFNLDKENLVIKSTNHVPTAAGLASSSSAFAALAAAFCAYYHIDADKTLLSRLARIGSGNCSENSKNYPENRCSPYWQNGSADNRYDYC